mgnify:CR=1 FL=1
MDVLLRWLAGDTRGETLRSQTPFGEGGTVSSVSTSPAAIEPDSAGSGPPTGGVVGVEARGFHVRTADFEGPFDLLLQLISQQRLDVTVVALHAVTDEFLAYVRGRDAQWDLDETTSFLVVAATLLDLKAARLLPGGQVEDDEDLALLEARDLLFARLLQYKAFKEVAGQFAQMMSIAPARLPRTAGIDPEWLSILPEVSIGLDPQEFAALAVVALTVKQPAAVGLAHLHIPQVSVREQAAIVIERLRSLGPSTFGQIVSDCDSVAYVIGRFLALLELYRDGVVLFEQESALGSLRISYVEGAQMRDQDFEEYGNAGEATVATAVAGEDPSSD